MAGPADFSAQATNIGETQNFVTPQQGIRDDSLASIIGGVGATALMGVETYATTQTNKFAKNYEEVLRVSLGGEALSPDEKQFKERMDRIQQTAQLGKTDTAKILREEFLRKSVGEKPWLATRFEAMAGRVDGRYTDLMAAFEKVEAGQAASAAADQKATMDIEKSLVKRLERLQTEMGGEPETFDGRPAVWEDLTPAEKRFNIAKYERALTNKRLLEARQKDADVKYTESERGRASYRFAQERAKIESADIAGNIVNDMLDRYANMAEDYAMKHPEASQEQLAVIGTQFISQLSNQLRIDLTRSSTKPGVVLTPADIDANVNNFTALATPHKDMLTGPASNASIVARQVEAAKASVQLEAYQILRPIAVLTEAGIPVDATMMDSVTAAIGSTGGADFKTQLGTAISDALRNVFNGTFQPSQTPTAAEVGAVGITTNLLVEANKTGTSAYKRMLERPESWVPMLIPAAYAVSRESDPRSRDIIYNSINNPAIIEKIATVPENIKEQVVNAIKVATMSKMGYLANPQRAGEYIAGFDPQTKQFVPANDSPQTKAYVKEANAVVGRVMFLEQKAYSNTDPYSVIRMYFGPSVADKVEPAQEQPQ
jgi:hypothetical protein